MELNLNRPIAFFDLETTGINVGKDRIVEIAIVKITTSGETKTKTWKVNPGMPIPPQSSAIHGIYDEDVKDCPTFEQLANEISQYLQGCDLGGYNSNKFDIPLLVEEFLRVGVDFEIKGRRLVDVQNIFHKMEQRTLSAAYKFYCGAELENAHSAEADAVATMEILKAQLDRYQGVEFKDKKGNISTPIVNDIDKLSEFSFHAKTADLAGQIIFNDKDQEVFNFGKYKGELVEKVFEKQPQYYDWMMKADFPAYTKKVITTIKLRSFNNGQLKIK